LTRDSLAAVMAKDGADKVAELLPSVQTRVNLDAVKELGFLLFHEAEKKKDTKDAILFNGSGERVG
jgi:putative DNA methylase